MNSSFTSTNDGYTSDTSSINATSTPPTDLPITHDTPAEDADYAACIFEIKWDKVRFAKGGMVLDKGELGWRVGHRKQVGGRGGVAKIWGAGADLVYREFGKVKEMRYWLCQACHTAGTHTMRFLEASGHKSIFGHLLSEHNLNKKLEIAGTKPAPVNRLLVSMSHHFNTRKQQLFVTAYPDWVIMHNLSFRQATSKETVAIFQLLRPGCHNLFYTSATSLSRIIQDNFTQRQAEIMILLHSAVSKIHLSSDLWSSSNDLSLLGVVAHFLDALHNHRTILLGLPRLLGSHGGSNIAACLLSVTQRYEITDRLGCFIMDNASNNDTMIAELQEQVPSVQENQRLRCAGHIINLVVKAILYGEGVKEFNRTIAGASDAQQFALWRKFGSIGKIHNTVKYIMRSDQRRQHFLSGQGSTSDDLLFDHTARLLIKDGGVRWNSTFHMMLRAVQLKGAITKFQDQPLDDTRERAYSPALDELDDHDWTEIKKYLGLLRHFVEATVHLEGNAEEEGNEGVRGAIWEVYPWLQVMWMKIDNAIERETVYATRLGLGTTQFKVSLMYGKKKLTEYWEKLMDTTPYYYAAVLLCPGRQMEWFTTWWADYPDWIRSVKKGMEELFGEHMRTVETETPRADSEPETHEHRKLPASVIKQRAIYRAMGIIDAEEEKEDTFAGGLAVTPQPSPSSARGTTRSKQARVETELERWYQFRPAEEILNPLEFWISEATNPKSAFPKLAKLALDIFSIPAMSSECERVFSETKRVITDDRNQLGAATIEAIQCQKNWIGKGVVHTELKTVVEQAART